MPQLGIGIGSKFNILNKTKRNFTRQIRDIASVFHLYLSYKNQILINMI